MRPSRAVKKLTAIVMSILVLLFVAGCSNNFIVLDPKGPIAEQQRDLMILSTLLCSIVIIPVLVLTAVIVLRYRDKKGRKAAYKPDWEHSTKLEVIWWGVPIAIIILLGFVTIKSTYALEPSKPLKSDVKPITIQVTSLNWKWLFQYPEQGIATVNQLKIPEGVPIKFEITADSPMNSFWIPQLGGQIYAMSGMAMTLYLQADEVGNYWGSGANFTGTHFADMYFDVEALPSESFETWVQEIKSSSPELTLEGYNQLVIPSTVSPKAYSSFPEKLFEMTVTKYASSHNHDMSVSKNENEQTETNEKPTTNETEQMDLTEMHSHHAH